MRRLHFLPLLVFLLILSGCDFLFDFERPDPVPSEDDDSNTLLGFPSERVEGGSQIIVHDAYTLLYSYENLYPVWVSWHLDSDDIGDLERNDNFQSDPLLPDEYQVEHADYKYSGFDRGHLCPNADRDGNAVLQEETFLMSNIAPQNGNLNRQDWQYLEAYCREQVENGSELFIIAGVYGEGGVDEDGNTITEYTNTNEKNAKTITIPSHFWKVVVMLDDGDGDLARIDGDTVAFAVCFNNAPVPDDLNWEDYTITIDSLEEMTGLDFLSTLPDDVEARIESRPASGV